MPLAIFGIGNTALNLVATIVVLVLVAIWLALIVFTFTDARRRISDPFLVGCATAASLFPFVGTMVYTILRPPEFLEDVRERETEIHESEIRLRHLEHNSCHKCGAPVESDFLRCPACRTRLKQPCPQCDRPVGLGWKVCPYCEKTLIASRRSSRGGSRGPGKPASGGRSGSRSAAPAKDGESSGKPNRTTRRRPVRASDEGEKPERKPAPGRKPVPDGDAPAGQSSRPRRRITVDPEEPGTPDAAGSAVADSGSEPINRGSGD